MKVSLLIHPTKNRFFNIGDYVQALAAAQFFDCDEFDFVDREALNTYDGEETKVIMNGWFMFTNNWPPSDKIHPLFVAFHINSTAKDILLSPQSIRYFKRHEPIGCRDKNSCELLRAHGVNAYFSGCLTLTLGRSYQNDLKGSDVYIVDPLIRPKKDIRSLFSYVMTLLGSFTKVLKIYKRVENKAIMPFVKCIVFYNQYSKILDDDVLLSAHYPSVYIQNNFETEVDKFDYAKKCLEKYSSAKFVITSKIHCNMPCIAMGTPCLFIQDDKDLESSSCRFGGLIDLYNVVKYKFGEFASDDVDLSQKITLSSMIVNKNKHHEISTKLVDSCIEFAK